MVKLIFPESGLVSHSSPNSSSKLSSYLSSDIYPSSLVFSYFIEDVDDFLFWLDSESSSTSIKLICDIILGIILLFVLAL